MISATTTFAWEIMEGETWNQLERGEKESYIEGFLEGFNITFISIMDEFEPELDIVSTAAQLEREGELLKLEEGDLDEAINNLDEIFKDAPDKTFFDLFLDDQFDMGLEP